MKTSLLLLVCVYANELTAQCTASGPLDGLGFSNNTSVGTYVWSNSGSAHLSDNIMSTAGISLGVFSSANSNYLVAQNFGFAIPALATVCGITLQVEKNAAGLGVGSSITDNSVRIMKGGVISGTNKATGTAWPPVKDYYTYGSSSDAWGLSWTPADINASNFGIAFSSRVSTGIVALLLTAQVDHFRMTVHYSLVLPVQFKDVQATVAADKVKVQWSTASETNSRNFVAEKLCDESNEWKEIGSLPAAENSTTEKWYSVTDNTPCLQNSYRIKQTDLDGKSVYSKIVAVKYPGTATNFIKVYPNPVAERININSSERITDLVLYDLAGKELKRWQPMSSVVSIPVSSGQPVKGIYMLAVTTPGGRTVHKLMLTK